MRGLGVVLEANELGQTLADSIVLVGTEPVLKPLRTGERRAAATFCRIGFTLEREVEVEGKVPDLSLTLGLTAVL